MSLALKCLLVALEDLKVQLVVGLLLPKFVTCIIAIHMNLASLPLSLLHAIFPALGSIIRVLVSVNPFRSVLYTLPGLQRIHGERDFKLILPHLLKWIIWRRRKAYTQLRKKKLRIYLKTSLLPVKARDVVALGGLVLVAEKSRVLVEV